MKYFELKLDTPGYDLDARCAELEALGINGFIIENEDDFHTFLEENTQYWDYVEDSLEEQYRGVSRIRFYLTDDDAGKALLGTVLERYPACSVSSVQDSDWENNWREYYRPIEVGEKLVVVPEWEEIPSGSRLPLRLDPGLIFGTGSHATTKMCLRALEKVAAPGKRVLDLGCGSGILGIGALVLGCEVCTGVDIDPKAPDVACANASLNGFGKDRFQVYAGDVLSDASLKRRLGTGYDIVLANIVADVILSLTPEVPAYLKEDGVYICSGIIDGREQEVLRALQASGFIVEEHFHEEEWNAFLCRL